jgi:hypothetical protein
MPSVRSFIDQRNVPTYITFTLCNLADTRSDARWHSVISCVSTATSHVKYVTLKTRLAALVNVADSSSREEYANAKSKFIDHVVQIALAAHSVTAEPNRISPKSSGLRAVPLAFTLSRLRRGWGA